MLVAVEVVAVVANDDDDDDDVEEAEFCVPSLWEWRADVVVS